MQTVKELMVEGYSYEEAIDLVVEAEGRTFDDWKDRQKELGTYHNPKVQRNHNA